MIRGGGENMDREKSRVDRLSVCGHQTVIIRRTQIIEIYLVGQFDTERHQIPPLFLVPTGSPSRDLDVALYVLDINQPSLPTPFYSVLVSVSVFTALQLYFIS